jgi:four helix bundle protein
MFTHEKFDAYQLSIQFVQLALELLDEIPSGHAYLCDQLRRGAFSICLNIAEGTGKNGRSDRARFYYIARGSAMECAAVCDLICLIDQRLGLRAEEAKAKLKSIVGILSTVCSAK